MDDRYSLPSLPYDFKALEPVISENQLRIHYEKHHQAYVKNANDILGKIEKAKSENTKLNMNAITRDLAFNVGGLILHSIFWPTMAPTGKGGKGPMGELAKAIERDFGTISQFKDEFGRTAVGVQGSGWAALTYEHQIDQLLVTQVESHKDNLYPTLPIVMILDVWEHAYYLDYQNERAKFVENWWKIVNWDGISKRFADIKEY